MFAIIEILLLLFFLSLIIGRELAIFLAIISLIIGIAIALATYKKKGKDDTSFTFTVTRGDDSGSKTEEYRSGN